MRNHYAGLDPLTRRFAETHPDTCAAIPLSPYQKACCVMIPFFLLLLLKFRWDLFIFLVCGSLMFLYAGAVIIRLSAAVLTLAGSGEIRIGKKELDSLDDEELPFYTILIPLYREPEIAAKIPERIERLDYPKKKLDVKLLLEKDDPATLEVLRNTVLPPHFSILTVPDAQPKTKPRACNFGLAEARGEFCVIFDAEDIPEPDQLKKAVAAFRKNTAEKIACIQAKLNYHNSRQNWLTAFFTVEYTAYFDLILAGWQKFGIPLPLGGTSNHFRTSVLRETGGWDPFNVTEDCELGIRIYEHGWKTAVLDSVTMEEANSRLWNWMRQRSRWVKGFIQTHYAHFRDLPTTCRRLGVYGAAGCFMSVGASALMMLTNLIFWPITLFYLTLIVHGLVHGETLSSMLISDNARPSAFQGMEFAGMIFKPWPLIYLGEGESPFWSAVSIIFCILSVFLLISNVLLVLIHAAAVVRSRRFHLLPFAFLMPFYWVLISFGAWKGFLQFFTKPFYWEKTQHGLDT